MYLGSATASASLLVGCLLALLLRRRPSSPQVPTLLFVAASVGVLLLIAMPTTPWLFAVLIPTVVSWWTALLIWARAPLSWRPLRYTGARSYAVYLWHFGIVWLTLTIAGPGLGSIALAILATFGIAEVSWLLVEQPARRRWHQYADARPGLRADEVSALGTHPVALDGSSPLGQVSMP